MAQGSISFDDSLWPVLVLTLRGKPSLDEYEQMFVGAEAMMRRGDKYVMITDARALEEVANAKLRSKMAERTKELDERYGPLRVASITILQSAIVRGALTAVHWFLGKKRREHVVGTMDEALKIALEVCRESGLSEPDIQHYEAG